MYDLYSRISLLCTEQNLNITQMCKYIGISRSVMSELKSGRTQKLSSDTTNKIAEYFNVATEYFFSSPPFNEWEKIYADLDNFFYHIPIPYENLKSIWGIDKDNPKSAQLRDIINFLSRCVNSVRVSQDGEWEIELLDTYCKLWHAQIVSDNEQAILPDNILPLPKTKSIPLVGSIACGTPIFAVENIEDYVKVDEKIPADFALRCKGDSMINSRIYDGDIVYIRQQSDVDDGEIAAVLIGEEATLKKVYKYSNKVVLRASNPMYDDMVYTDEELENIIILGKAVAFFSLVR